MDYSNIPIPSVEEYIDNFIKYEYERFSCYNHHVVTLRTFLIYKIISLSSLSHIEPEYFPPTGFLESKQFLDLREEFKLNKLQLSFHLNRRCYWHSYWSLEYINLNQEPMCMDLAINNRK